VEWHYKVRFAGCHISTTSIPWYMMQYHGVHTKIPWYCHLIFIILAPQCIFVQVGCSKTPV